MLTLSANSGFSACRLSVGVNQTTYTIGKEDIYFAGFDERRYLTLTKRGMRHSLSAVIGAPSIIG